MAAWSDPNAGIDANVKPREQLFSNFAPGVNVDKFFGQGGEAFFEDPNRKPGDFMGLNPRSKNFAQDAFAAITRQQWDDYLTNYVPMENRLIDYATDETKPQDAAYVAGRGVGAAFDQQRQSTDRRLAGMGLQLTDEERGAVDKQSRLSESLATVGAMNNARDATVQRQQSIIGNPTPTLPKGGFQ